MMLKKSMAVTTVAALSLSLSACSTLEGSERVGSIAGTAFGAVAAVSVFADGGLTASILAGLGGGLIGSQVGKRVARSVYQRDLAKRDYAYRRALGQYVQQGWNNPDTQSYGAVKRLGVAYQKGDEVCAQFKEDYRVEGKVAFQDVMTTACLSERGWRTIA